VRHAVVGRKHTCGLACENLKSQSELGNFVGARWLGRRTRRARLRLDQPAGRAFGAHRSHCLPSVGSVVGASHNPYITGRATASQAGW
jgi:hypothetical protein